MTLTGADYLLHLSGLAVSIVGFASVVVALLRALGADLTPLHMYFVRFFIEGGLGLAGLCLLPAALSFTSLSESTIWRVSSGAAAAFYSVYFIVLFRRRRRVTPGQIPFPTRVAFAISIIAMLALWLNAVGLGFQRGVTPCVIAHLASGRGRMGLRAESRVVLRQSVFALDLAGSSSCRPGLSGAARPAR